MRAVSGDKTAFAYSDEINMAALESAAQATRTIARSGAGGKARIASAAALADGARTERTGHSLYPMRDPIASLDAAGKVALLHKIEKHARARDPRVIQVMAGLAAEHDVIMVMRSDGVMACLLYTSPSPRDS